MVRQKGSLRNKIITWSFVPTAIILVAVALVSLFAYQRVTENLVIERDRELTRLSAKLLGSELAAYTNPLADQYLAIFDGIAFLDADGNVLAAEPMQYEIRSPSWLRGIPLSKMFESSEPIFSDVVVDRMQGDDVIVAAMPIAPRNGNPGGGIVGFFRLGPAEDSTLFRSIKKLSRGASSCAYVVDGRGHVIYHTTPGLVGDDFASLDAVQQVTAGLSGALRTRNFEGQNIVASYAPVPGTSWGLVTEENWADLNQLSRRYGQYLFLLLAAGIVAPIVIVTIGVRRITEPIGKVIRAACEIAGGNFDQRIEASTGDEMESLAQQFNRMAGQLQESYAHLEQKVSDRTRELATLNVIATEVSQSLDLSEVLHKALDEVLAVMGMAQGAAFYVEEETGELTLVVHRAASSLAPSQAARPAPTDSVAWQAVTSRRPVVKARDVQVPDDLPSGTQQQPSRLTVCIPLVARSKALGVIRLDGEKQRTITDEELTLLAAIGNQVGMAVENARLYEQAQQLAVVRERNRLARDLHDSVMQALYGVTLYAEAAARQLAVGDGDLAANHLGEIRTTTQEALREMRLLIFELRPAILKSNGLAAAIQARLEGVEGRVGITTQFTTSGDCRLSPAVEEELYRIAQEALNNVLKHAMAHEVHVDLRGNGRTVTLQVSDDGVGFDVDVARERGGIGLHSMEERVVRLGAKLAVQSQPGTGTSVYVEVCR